MGDNDADTSQAEEALRSRRSAPWIDDPNLSLRQQVWAEFRSYLRPPYEVPSVVAFNAALVLGAWFLINPDVVMNHTALVFLPIAIASWAYADVPATNLLGGRADDARTLLDDPRALRRAMTVANLALWILVSPACLALSLALLPSQNEPTVSLAIGIACLALPFAFLGLAAIVAPLLPFHPLPWQVRVRRRDTWLRYSAAVLIAYFCLTWPAAALALGPALAVLALVGDQPQHYLLGAILITPWCLFLWRAGLHIATKIVRRRRAWLDDFLSDPSNG